MNKENLTFNDALKILGIEEYSERIFNSNSHGELFHLSDYFVLAQNIIEPDLKLFPVWFKKVIEDAEKNWKRPESVFQHILKIFIESVKP